MPVNGLYGRITARAASEFGDTAAFVAAGGWPLSYADLDSLVEATAHGLHRRGLSEGDVVALVLPSTPDYIVSYLAAAACGVLAHGFARLRCTDCALERLVPFSCKGRGFCPSCGGRRMTEAAAHLVEVVLPRVPVPGEEQI